MSLDTQKIINNLAKLDVKYQYYFLTAFVILIFVIDFLFVLNPQLSRISEKNAELKILTENLERAQNEIQRLDHFKSELERMREQINTTSLNIKTKQEVPLILEELSRVANEFNVTIDQLMPLKEGVETLVTNEDVSYYALPIKVQARSGYHDFARFINKLERESLFLNLHDFRINSNDRDTKKHIIQMTIKAVVIERPIN